MPTTAQERIYDADGEEQDLGDEKTSKEAKAQNGSAFTTGSDVEIAEHVKYDLQVTYGGGIVFCEGEFWYYAKTHWSKISRDKLWLAVSVYDGAIYPKKGIIRLGASRIESTLKHLEKLHSNPGFFSNAADGANCLSGFVEFATDGTPSLVEHSPFHLKRNTLPVRWDPDKRVLTIPPSLARTLLYGSTTGDPEQPEKIEALLRLAGAVVAGLGTKGLHPKVVILKGVPDTGKKQLLAMFRGLVPANARCSISPSQFAVPHYIVEMSGKLLNTYDELGSTYAVTSEVFKQVATGDPVTGCRKYGHPFTFTPTAQNIFACNLLPPFRGGVDPAVLKRLYIIQMNRSIPLDEREDNIGQRIVDEELELLFGLAIEGASRLIRDRGFPRLESSEAELVELAETDSVVAWCKDRIKRTPLAKVNKDGTSSPVRLTTSQMYTDYKMWAEAQGHDRKSIAHVNVFSQRLRSHGLTHLNRNGFRGFVGVCFGAHEDRPAEEAEPGAESTHPASAV
jgi:phage/plasmid-associated DNA primase